MSRAGKTRNGAEPQVRFGAGLRRIEVVAESGETEVGANLREVREHR